jgi:hypothetical protein
MTSTNSNPRVGHLFDDQPVEWCYGVIAGRSRCPQSMMATAPVVTLISPAGAVSARRLYPFQNVVHTWLSSPTMNVSRLAGARDTAATCWFT